MSRSIPFNSPGSSSPFTKPREKSTFCFHSSFWPCAWNQNLSVNCDFCVLAAWSCRRPEYIALLCSVLPYFAHRAVACFKATAALWEGKPTLCAFYFSLFLIFCLDYYWVYPLDPGSACFWSSPNQLCLQQYYVAYGNFGLRIMPRTGVGTCFKPIFLSCCTSLAPSL